MRIFLTGATGYIGGSVAAALIAGGHEVQGLVRSEERADQARAHGIDPRFSDRWMIWTCLLKLPRLLMLS